jgi:hypothetical protein
LIVACACTFMALHEIDRFNISGRPKLEYLK